MLIRVNSDPAVDSPQSGLLETNRGAGSERLLLRAIRYSSGRGRECGIQPGDHRGDSQSFWGMCS